MTVYVLECHEAGIGGSEVIGVFQGVADAEAAAREDAGRELSPWGDGEDGITRLMTGPPNSVTYHVSPYVVGRSARPVR